MFFSSPNAFISPAGWDCVVRFFEERNENGMGSKIRMSFLLDGGKSFDCFAR